MGYVLAGLLYDCPGYIGLTYGVATLGWLQVSVDLYGVIWALGVRCSGNECS